MYLSSIVFFLTRMRGEAPFLPTVSDFLQLYLCETYRANFDESKQDITFCFDQSLVEFDYIGKKRKDSFKKFLSIKK